VEYIRVSIQMVRMRKVKKTNWERRGNVPRLHLQPKVSAAAADRVTKKFVSPVVGSNDQVPEKKRGGSFTIDCWARSRDHPILLTTKQDETMQQQKPPLFNETQSSRE
jgi:hypothetical protein